MFENISLGYHRYRFVLAYILAFCMLSTSSFAQSVEKNKASHRTPSKMKGSKPNANSANANKSTTATKRKVQAKNKRALKHPMSAKERAMYGKPFPLLKFRQLAKLEHTQRVKYLRELRNIVVNIEINQNMYKRTNSASLFDPKLKQQNELYAFIFGQFSHALEPHGRGSRNYVGGPQDDDCIQSFNLMPYETRQSSQLQPHGCPKTPCSQSPGSRCGELVSGFGFNGVEKCIDDVHSWQGTKKCNEERHKLMQDPSLRAKIAALRQKSEAHFAYDVPNGARDLSKLTDENAVEIINELAGHAWDDEAYSELIRALALLRRNNVERVNGKAQDIYEKIQPAKFETEFDSVQAAVNNIFGGYIDHCDRPLQQNVIADLESKLPLLETPENETPSQMGRNAWVLERKRLKALADFRQAKRSGSEYTVRNILEIEECLNIDDRYKPIKDRLERVVGTYPQTPDDVPPSLPPLAEPTLETPAPGTHPGAEQISTGCSRDITADGHQLHMPAARCMVCLAEKSADNYYGADYKPQGKADQYSTPKRYTVSTKWMSLLSTMALACGHGTQNGTYLTPEIMLEQMQTFGHCDADTYDWDPTRDLNARERELIEKWSTDTYWKNASDSIAEALFGDGQKPDAEDEFSSVYGIRYDEATTMFCDLDRFKKSFELKNSALRFRKQAREYKEEGDYKTPDSITRMKFGRAQFANNVESNNRLRKKLENSQGGALFKCMQESLTNARNLYSGDNSRKTCQQMIQFDNSDRWHAPYHEMLNNVLKQNLSSPAGHSYPQAQRPKRDASGYYEPAGTTTFSNGATCYVATQWEGAYKTEPAADGTRQYALTPDGKLQYEHFAINLDDPKDATGKGLIVSTYPTPDGRMYNDQPPEVYVGSTRTPTDRDTGVPVGYSFTSPTPAACSAFAGAPPRVEFAKGWDVGNQKTWWGGKKKQGTQ